MRLAACAGGNRADRLIEVHAGCGAGRNCQPAVSKPCNRCTQGQPLLMLMAQRPGQPARSADHRNDCHLLARPQLPTRRQPPALHPQRDRSTVRPEGDSADQPPTERLNGNPGKCRRISANRCPRPDPDGASPCEQDHQGRREHPRKPMSSAPAATPTRHGRQQRRRPRRNCHPISMPIAPAGTSAARPGARAAP
jgi:hypothetical protein